MKKNKLILTNLLGTVAFLLLLLSLEGCDGLNVGNAFLEKPPGEGITQDTVFSNAEYAEFFLARVYESLPYGLDVAGPYDTDAMHGDPLAVITDLGQSYKLNGGGNIYYDNRYNSSTQDGFEARHTKYNFHNSGAWEGIRGAYTFINNVDKVPDMDEVTKRHRKAEARMIIALHYTQLFRHFGGMVWVDHAYDPNEDFQSPRLTARATLDSTVAMIDQAIPDLPFALDNPSTEAGRFTQAGAMGLKCRVLLFGASPLFNSSQPYMQGEAADENLVWYGGEDPSLWQDAADACGALIDKVEQAGGYHLADTGQPRKDFQHAYYDRDSPELLISTRKRYKAGGMPGGMINSGAMCATDNYVEMFPMADGTPIDDPNSGYDPQNPYQNRDPRLYESVLTNGDAFQNRSAELWLGGRERKNKTTPAVRTGYRGRKFVLDIRDARNNPVQWPYLRLAEIYLSYAEALNQVNGDPTPEAYEYANKVRNRVDLNDLPSGLSQEEFREAIIKERVLELSYENARWFDIIRWKMEDVFTKTLYGMNICKKGESPQGACQDNGVGYHESDNYIYARFKLPERYWKNNFSPKYYLSAFPLSEINKQYGLIQNPGWKQ